MIPNKFAKSCKSCDKKVGVGEGFAYKNGYMWLTVCSSTACIKRLGLTVPKPEEKKRMLLADGTIRIPYDRDAIPLIKGLAGSKCSGPPDWIWKVSVKDQDLPVLLATARLMELEIAQELLDREAAGNPLTEEADRRIKSNKNLYDFQKEGVKFLVLHDKAILADDMGLGKSNVTITSLPEKARVLCVCLASVKYNWQNEFKRWRPEFKTVVLEGKNAFKVPEENEVVIINYDILPEWLVPKKIESNGKVEFQSCINPNIAAALKDVHFIADEIQQAKNYKTKKYQKTKSISQLAKAVWALTGTPVDNRPSDLYGILSACNINVFGSWTNFLKAFNGYKNSFGGYEWGDPRPEVPEKLKRIMLRRLKKDVLKELPDKTYTTIKTEISGGLKKELDNVLKELKQGYEEYSDEEFLNLTVSKLPKFEEFAKIRAKLAKDRIPAALEIVETYEESGTPLVVFSDHKEPVETIGSREGWAYITGDITGKKRQEIVDKFQNGELKGIAVTITAGGVGITLTRASHELFTDRNWRATQNMQAEDRCHRIGQKENVLVMTMVSDHILDTHITNLLQKKINLMNLTLESQIKYKPIKKISAPELVEESLEELEDRINNAEKEAERELARAFVHNILAREQAKSSLPEPELTDSRKALIRSALEYMMGRCDGAHLRDGVGFNKPDAAIAHYIFATGMRVDDEITYRVTERILSRYHKQLKENYQAIWKPEL